MCATMVPEPLTGVEIKLTSQIALYINRLTAADQNLMKILSLFFSFFETPRSHVNPNFLNIGQTVLFIP